MEMSSPDIRGGEGRAASEDAVPLVEHRTSVPTPAGPVPVFFLSGSTGITAETMGNAVLVQFPQLVFERRLFPFITTVEEARRVVGVLDAAVDGPVRPLAFSTVPADAIRGELHRSRCPLIDFYELHLSRVESILGVRGQHVASRLHAIGDVQRYNTRMAAVEYAIEHDDGHTLRALDRAEVILLAPSRCGKTPTTMYLALQHGLFSANYPLVEEDLDTSELPRPVRALRDRCVGMLVAPARLSEVRQQRRPNSRYASFEQCAFELRRAAAIYEANRLPVIDSTARSVEEMSTLILQILSTRTSTHSRSSALTSTAGGQA
jgi:regulator of PEP synthase PpsR (kinase-PPPase family)